MYALGVVDEGGKKEEEDAKGFSEEKGVVDPKHDEIMGRSELSLIIFGVDDDDDEGGGSLKARYSSCDELDSSPSSSAW